MSIRIKEAILRYNSKKKDSEEKMNQKKLGTLLLPGKSDSFISFRMSRWSTGEDLSGLRIEHIRKMCEFLNCDANYLLGVKPVKE